MPVINSKSLSLFLFLVLHTIASADSNPLAPPQFQNPSSSVALSFPHDDAAGNSNDLLVASGWTTAGDDLGNTDNLIDQQVVNLADDRTVTCADSAPPEDGSPITTSGEKRRSRLLRKRDPPGFCRSQAPSSSSGGTTITINKKRPSRPPGKTEPIRMPKAMPLLGDPNSPLCNEYFPGVGSSYAVCYYSYFKTIPRTPLVHMVSPCRACKYDFPWLSSAKCV